jgi:hypothetical protein
MPRTDHRNRGATEGKNEHRGRPPSNTDAASRIRKTPLLGYSSRRVFISAVDLFAIRHELAPLRSLPLLGRRSQTGS